jgi:hypothetical protein
MWTATPYVLSVDDVLVVAAPLVAQNDAYSVAQGATLTVAAPGVLGNDTGGGGSALTATLVSQAAHGMLSLQANGAFIYTPEAGFTGTDTFTYRASTGGVTSNTATVTLTVTAF